MSGVNVLIFLFVIFLENCCQCHVDGSLTLWKICAFLFFCRELGQVHCATNLIHHAAKTLLADHTGDRTKGNKRLC